MKLFFQSILLFLLPLATLTAQERVLSLRGEWKFRLGDDMSWATGQFDDSKWDQIYAPSEWENEGFNGYDGYAWYRKTFSGERLKDKYNLVLNLGYIDDADQVFFNGELIGYSGTFPPKFTTAYNALRVYNIPQELIRDGENVIAVRVFDTVLGGGIVSGEIGIYEERDAQHGAMTLEGLWKFSEGDNMVWKNPGFDDSDWAYMMAPGFWRYLGKKNFMSYGWYRKTFRLPERLDNKQLTLILGLIDDFDEVYLNGKLIGSTNDQRGYGHSQSYRKLRIYPIPDNVINYDGKNTISVRIRDLGGEAGIYKGPLVIVESRYAALFVRDHYDNY